MPKHTELARKTGGGEIGTMDRETSVVPRNPASTERSGTRRKVGSLSGVASGSMGTGSVPVHTSSEETQRGG